MPWEGGIVEVVAGLDRDQKPPVLEVVSDGFPEGEENKGSEEKDENGTC